MIPVATRGPAPASRVTLLGAVFVGGAAGALARVGVGHVLSASPAGWPWATLVVNVVGTLILGFVNERLREGAATSWRGALAGTGFCGALTTFSTFQWEVIRMAQAGRGTTAAAYVAVSLAAGLVAVDVGARIARLRDGGHR